MIIARQSEPRSNPPGDRLSAVDTLLRIGLSVLIITFFGLSVRLFFLNRDYAVVGGYVRPGDHSAERVESQGPSRTDYALEALPIPMMPGAKRPTGVKMNFNGGDFIRVEFDTHARFSDVLRFYRNWLRQRGWSDWVEDSYRPRHGGSFQEIPGLPGGMQNESLLRFYDQMQRNQLNFAKGDKRVSVFAKPSEDRPYGNRIALQYMEKGSPAAITRGRGRKRYQPIMQFSERMGKDVMRTSFIQDRTKPAEFHRVLVSRFRRQGWETATVPYPKGRELPDHYTQMGRGPDSLYLQVMPNSEAKGSIATITTVSSPVR